MGFYWSYTLLKSSRPFLCALVQLLDPRKNFPVYSSWFTFHIYLSPPYPPVFFPCSLSSPLLQGNLRSWLLDENCYDQCAIIYNAGDTVAISQSTPHEIKVVTERKVRRAEGDACTLVDLVTSHTLVWLTVLHLASPLYGILGTEIHLRRCLLDWFFLDLADLFTCSFTVYRFS